MNKNIIIAILIFCVFSFGGAALHYKGDLKSTEEENVELDIELQEATKKNEELKLQIKTLKAEISKLNEDYKKLGGENKKLLAKQKELEERIGELKEVIGKYGESNEAILAEVNVLAKELQSVKKEKDEIVSNQREINKERDAKTALFANLSNQKNELESELEKLEKMLKENDEKLKDWRRREAIEKHIEKNVRLDLVSLTCYDSKNKFTKSIEKIKKMDIEFQLNYQGLITDIDGKIFSLELVDGETGDILPYQEDVKGDGRNSQMYFRYQRGEAIKLRFTNTQKKKSDNYHFRIIFYPDAKTKSAAKNMSHNIRIRDICPLIRGGKPIKVQKKDKKHLFSHKKVSF